MPLPAGSDRTGRKDLTQQIPAGNGQDGPAMRPKHPQCRGEWRREAHSPRKRARPIVCDRERVRGEHPTPNLAPGPQGPGALFFFGNHLGGRAGYPQPAVQAPASQSTRRVKDNPPYLHPSRPPTWNSFAISRLSFGARRRIHLGSCFQETVISWRNLPSPSAQNETFKFTPHALLARAFPAGGFHRLAVSGSGLCRRTHGRR